MKISNYSLNYSDLIARGEMDVFRFLGLCRAMGLEGASLHLGNLADTKTETLARVRRAFLDQGLSVAMVTVSTDFGRPADRLGAEFERARGRSRRRRSWRAALARLRRLGATGNGSALGLGARGRSLPPRLRGGRAAGPAHRLAESQPRRALRHGCRCGSLRPGSQPPEPDRRARLRAVCRQPRRQRCLGRCGRPGRATRQHPPDRAAGAPRARQVLSPARDGSEPGIPYDQVFDILRAVHYPGFLDIVYEPARPGGEPAQTAIPRIVNYLRRRFHDARQRNTPEASAKRNRPRPHFGR